MSGRWLRLSCVALSLGVLSVAAACASMQVPGNATTQALGEASAVTGAVASTVGLAAPVPWGQIVAAALGAVSVIDGNTGGFADVGADQQRGFGFYSGECAACEMIKISVGAVCHAATQLSIGECFRGR